MKFLYGKRLLEKGIISERRLFNLVNKEVELIKE